MSPQERVQPLQSEKSPDPKPHEPSQQDEVLTSHGVLGSPQKLFDDPRNLTPEKIQHLQRTIGNQAVMRMLDERRIQRQGEDGGAADTAETAPQQFIVEDTAEDVQGGQMRKSEFLDELENRVCDMANMILALVGRDTDSCPYIAQWFGYYRGRSGEQVERAIHRYAPETANAASASEYFPAIVNRVREGVQTWVITGEVTGVPDDIPMDMAGGTAEGGEQPSGGEGEIAFKAEEGGAVEVDDPRDIQAQLREGKPLESGLRSGMENAFGEDFSDVRIHTDTKAARLSDNLNARAFTIGSDVAFGNGEYQPNTPIGDALIAHELAHVVQQQGSSNSVAAKQDGQGAVSDFEDDADMAAVNVVARMWGGMERVSDNVMPQLRSGLRLQRCNRNPAPPPPAPPTFEQYQNQFNPLWTQAPYNTEATTFNPALSSKGPRTPRSRAIFNHIYSTDPAIHAAYDNNTGDIRTRIDTYTGPEGLNLINSPRLAALQAAFTGFAKPVPNADYPALRTAVQAAATNLDAADRDAINNSNEWQQLINDYVTDDAKRSEIRGIITPTVAPAPAPPPAAPGAPLTQAQKITKFVNDWQGNLMYNDGARQNWWVAGTHVQYWGGTQNFSVSASSSLPNPGQVFYVRAQILRGAAVIRGPEIIEFPVNQDSTGGIAMPVSAPGAVPAAGDNLTVRVELLAANRTTVRKTQNMAVTVMPEVTYTQAQALAAAAADNAHFHDATPAGLLGKMQARGGAAANVAEAIVDGRIRVRPLSIRHDSNAYVTAQNGGVPNPAQLGYFVGHADYAESFAGVTGAGAFSLGGAAGNIVLNRTTDIPSVARRSDNELIMLIIHEAVHALDKRPNAGTEIEAYKTEFRAYWMDGRYGPPDQGTCPNPVGNCKSTAYDPNMSPPGPKSERARAIFDGLYGSATYPNVKPHYDNNINGFREQVDNYLIPDGINLIASIRLDDLNTLIDGWGGANFATFRNQVRAFMGHGAAPANGALTAREKQEIASNRMWRDLVERKVPVAAQQSQIKGDLGIPQ